MLDKKIYLNDDKQFKYLQELSMRILFKAQILLVLWSHELLSTLYVTHQFTYSLWSVKLATLFSATGGFGSAIHVEYMDFVPELGWQFWSLNL